MELLTVKEVAHILKRAESTVRRWLREGEIEGVKIANKDWRIRETDLKKYLSRKKGA